MIRTPYAIAGAGTGFLLLLLYTTLRTTSTPLQQAPEGRAAAQSVCQNSVRTNLPGARFPFGATVEDRGAGQLRLSGSVDAGSAGQTVRRNYECLVRRDGSGAYVTDSVQVWQSH